MGGPNEGSEGAQTRHLSSVNEDRNGLYLV